MAAPSSAALRDELLSFSAATIEDNVLQSFQYEGFSATYIYGLLRMREANFATFNREMSLLCLVGMLRGTRVDKISASMSVAGATLLTQLVNKYTIINTVAAANRKGSITIGRIMSVFPHVCLTLAVSGHLRTFGLSGDYTLPRACRFPQFAALIPNSDDYGWLWDAFMVWAYDMDQVINSDRANAANVSRFANITSTNSLFDNNQRRTILANNNLSFDLDDEEVSQQAAQTHAQDAAAAAANQQALASQQQAAIAQQQAQSLAAQQQAQNAQREAAAAISGAGQFFQTGVDSGAGVGGPQRQSAPFVTYRDAAGGSRAGASGIRPPGSRHGVAGQGQGGSSSGAQGRR